MFVQKFLTNQMVRQVMGAAMGMLIATIAYSAFDAASTALRARVASGQHIDTSPRWTAEDRKQNMMRVAEHAKRILLTLEPAQVE